MDFIKSPKSAIVIIPKVSDGLWKSIQNIRRENDKAYERWMPHVNLIFPFRERQNDDFGSEVAAIKRCFKECDVRKFRMKYAAESVGFFEMSKNFVVWIKPLPLYAPSAKTELEREKLQMHKKVQGELEVRKKLDGDIEWMAKYCVNPFGLVAENANDVSLFDLHVCNHTNSEDIASLFNFSKKNYAIWDNHWKNKKASKKKQYAAKPKEKGIVTKSVQFEFVAEPSADAIFEEHEAIFEEHFEDQQLLKVKRLSELQRLQASLVRAFPKCDDLNKISSAGFQPHLTLGQYKKRNISEVVAKIAEELFNKPEEFTIDSIHIITRHSLDDKFEIRATIDLPFS